MKKKDKIKQLMALNSQYIYIYMPLLRCFWIDCYGEQAKLQEVAGTIMTTIDHSCNHYLVVDQMETNKTKLLGGVGEKGSTNQYRTQNRIYSSSSSINTGFNPFIADEENDMKLNIRKLTPRECGRLMGVKDEDIDLMREHLSDAELYHCFGDSLITTIIMAIISDMVGIDWKEKINFKEWLNGKD